MVAQPRTDTGHVQTPVSSENKPLPPSNTKTEAIQDHVTSNPGKEHEDNGTTGPAHRGKTEKEVDRERRKNEKQARFEQKIQSNAVKNVVVSSRTKGKKANVKKEDEVQLEEYINDTPPGQKKILRSLEDPYYKAYYPPAVESAWYDWWEQQGFFKPEFTEDGRSKPEGSFVIVTPPPNVTGALHMGHALGTVLQDSMIRWNRMHGKTTLWLPGCDHAGISTQNVVENMLWRRRQQTRHDLGREKFVETVWEWKEEYHTRINHALRKMGGSFDWSREAFTMDANLSAAVTDTFVRLHEEGVIYRGSRLVNWCTKLTTALSNLEVINKELTGRTLLDVPGYDRKVEFGVIIHFKYPLEESDEKIEVATTRIETMLGDTGIAVHPEDSRYRHLIGKNAVHPFIPGRLLPIVADEYVDRGFGTGAVKLTPAHDANDFALGQKHNLPFINILTDHGLMNENAGVYQGQRRFDVRYTIQEDLKKLGLYVGKKDNPMRVPVCEKSEDIIEPLMKPQWWMRMRELADEAVKVVKSGEIKIHPESAEKSYFRWMGSINDWCLSRQLWWGHQAPVYFAQISGEVHDEGDGSLWFSGRTKEEAERKARRAIPDKTFTLKRDGDVLDTWFSSGLWPFSTLGWPGETHDFETLYPTSVLETAWDILFFWVARMIMLGKKLTGKVPFTEVYCHSIVRDSEGRKMSKSLGNVIDPLDVIKGITLEDLHAKLLQGNLHPDEVEKAKKYQKTAFPDGIPQCGADAMRFCLAAYATGGGDINFDVKVMHGYRKFCNKIYQATKYVLGKLGPDFTPRQTPQVTGKESLSERWILHKMTMAAKEMNAAIAAREFAKATQVIYQYWYNQLCDVYIENSKVIVQYGSEEERRSAIETLYTALEGALTMIHPFMPFLTEELWQRLPRRPCDRTPSITVAKYPVYNPDMDCPSSEAAYELVLGVSKGVRSLMSRYSLQGESQVFIRAHTTTARCTLMAQLQSIKSLAGKGVSEIAILDVGGPNPGGCVAFPVAADATVLLHVKGRVDIDAEISKASTKLQRVCSSIRWHSQRLSAHGYMENATEEVVESDKHKLADLEAERDSLQATLGAFQRLNDE
ncbi:valine--tRNA ligase [Exophiala dermatitidis]|uniref:valine--tRNA ligase n=1 Tax=Exophiala dermatitidis TaxID=5970 RepID=A0AAN6EZU3_EXODE|nr:valine--tRNA ligase [Exophiala dermatitidis]KAJ4578889.1 valine--tRNA ligase [Exophiala dermatitidis]KAJ4586260.1 valine--tRNA ligase [Exophiala dermatitidis]KAJ4603017.1 valine--tRNA ligase [Exophiala dermatitidis]KAJ4629880.1 valine--tRNA ligase [Exophiala dermatitidis]